MKLMRHEIVMRHNINAVGEQFSLQLKQFFKKIRSKVHKINVDINQPLYSFHDLLHFL